MVEVECAHNSAQAIGHLDEHRVADVVLRDLNSEGMCIETRHQMRVGASYPFKIRRGHQQATIDGKVIWCKLLRMIDIGGGESQALYRAGIAFSRRLEDFRAVPSVDAGTGIDLTAPPPAESIDVRKAARSAVLCPDCRVPAVAGALRCGICGTILPQA